MGFEVNDKGLTWVEVLLELGNNDNERKLIHKYYNNDMDSKEFNVWRSAVLKAMYKHNNKLWKAMTNGGRGWGLYRSKTEYGFKCKICDLYYCKVDH